jgi:two-component system response regulator PilR (NtrC family)
MAMDTIPSGAAPRIAIATTDESVQLAAQEILASVFHTTLLGSGTEIMPLLDEVSLEAIILDLETAHVSDPEVLRLIRKLRHQDETLVLLGFTRSHNKAARSQFEQAGISHCFVAPVDFEEVQKVLQRALEERAAEIENRRLREEARNRNSFCQLIGGSDSMRLVYDSISRLAESSVNVLIRGESGTGKELVAQAIVASGPRRAKPFVSVNCAALPESLIEAELFGHEKGSFTDAHEARAGHIEAAHGGTLFLDEIGTLGLGLQSKLLRVLEQHVIQRIGSRSGKKIDFRLIAATNEDLEEAVRVGRFREDLYYRINVVPIVLPPLRERPGDLAILLDHFLRMYCAANSLPLKRLDSDALEILEEYHWPGNVRELENLVQRLVIMGSGAVITAKHLPQQILYTSTAKQEALLIPEEGISFDQEIARIELAYLQAALRRTGGKKVAAAALLQINAQKMKYLCRKYGLKG